MCCMRLAGNKGRKNDAKIAINRNIAKNLSGYVFATKGRIDNRKKIC